MAEEDGDRARLREGERVMFVDSRGRRYVVALEVGSEFHSHAGVVLHDAVIGQSEGVQVRSTGDAKFVVVRPTLTEHVLKMPRGAQVIYPKDLGPMLLLADIFPGARVFESGLGSGALSTTLLRAGADIVGYELRDEFAARAAENVASFLGPEALDRYHVEVRSAYDGIDGDGFDRVVLDLPEPWQVVPHATGVLRPGGILVSYSPSILQVTQLRGALDKAGFGMAETVEIFQRHWHVDGPAVRPEHRMVAHTGFLTSARRLDG